MPRGNLSPRRMKRAWVQAEMRDRIHRARVRSAAKAGAKKQKERNMKELESKKRKEEAQARRLQLATVR